jgi:hypothetical protein
LHVAFRNKARLVLDDGAALVALDLEDPLQADWAMAGREVDKAPSVVVLDGCHLLEHRAPPWLALFRLDECGGLIGSYKLQLL